MLNSALVSTSVRRDRIVVVACIALVTILAWAYLVYLAHQMSADTQDNATMAAMGMEVDTPRKWTDFFFTFAMWAVMMVGMMAPSASPMLLMFAGAQARRRGGNRLLMTLTFGLGYLAVWTGFSVGAAVGQLYLHQAALLSSAMAISNSKLTGAIFLLAGAYQLTPWKGKCLTHCRSPLGFLMTNWQDGTVGAFTMGARHGAYCLGCCWALMCVLFAVGVMSIVWVAALTVFVLIEKIGPAGAVVARIAGAALVVLGIAKIF